MKVVIHPSPLGFNFRAGCFPSLFSAKITYSCSSVPWCSFQPVQLLLSCLVAVFCLAKLSLFCFDWNVVILFRRVSVTPPSSPSNFPLSVLSLSPCFVSYCKYHFPSVKDWFIDNWLYHVYISSLNLTQSELNSWVSWHYNSVEHKKPYIFVLCMVILNCIVFVTQLGTNQKS